MMKIEELNKLLNKKELKKYIVEEITLNQENLDCFFNESFHLFEELSMEKKLEYIFIVAIKGNKKLNLFNDSYIDSLMDLLTIYNIKKTRAKINSKKHIYISTEELITKLKEQKGEEFIFKYLKNQIKKNTVGIYTVIMEYPEYYNSKKLTLSVIEKMQKSDYGLIFFLEQELFKNDIIKVFLNNENKLLEKILCEKNDKSLFFYVQLLEKIYDFLDTDNKNISAMNTMKLFVHLIKVKEERTLGFIVELLVKMEELINIPSDYIENNKFNETKYFHFYNKIKNKNLLNILYQLNIVHSNITNIKIEHLYFIKNKKRYIQKAMKGFELNNPTRKNISYFYIFNLLGFKEKLFLSSFFEEDDKYFDFKEEQFNQVGLDKLKFNMQSQKIQSLLKDYFDCLDNNMELTEKAKRKFILIQEN